MDLFSGVGEAARQGRIPLATRMRPTSLNEIVGQKHLIGKGNY
jgi:putative ATPase